LHKLNYVQYNFNKLNIFIVGRLGMGSLRYVLVILLIVMVSACTDSKPGQSAKSAPGPDNQENRLVEAKRFMEIMPPKELLQGLAARVAPSIPEKDRQKFTEVMKSKNIEQSADKITLDALVKHYTTGELRAMVEFYGSPDGHTAYKKFPAYMADIMPQIQQEVKNAMVEVQKEQKPQEPTKPQGQPSGGKEQKPPQSQK
jgi:uncharacterized protein